MKTITINVVLSEEVIEDAKTFAQMIDVTPQQFLSYLAEGWTSPRSNLRKRLASASKVELAPPRKNGLCTKNTARNPKRAN